MCFLFFFFFVSRRLRREATAEVERNSRKSCPGNRTPDTRGHWPWTCTTSRRIIDTHGRARARIYYNKAVEVVDQTVVVARTMSSAHDDCFCFYLSLAITAWPRSRPVLKYAFVARHRGDEGSRGAVHPTTDFYMFTIGRIFSVVKTIVSEGRVSCTTRHGPGTRYNIIAVMIFSFAVNKEKEKDAASATNRFSVTRLQELILFKWQ